MNELKQFKAMLDRAKIRYDETVCSTDYTMLDVKDADGEAMRFEFDDGDLILVRAGLP